MMNLIKVISNELENNRFETEDKLDKVLNSKELTLEDKKSFVIEYLGDIAIAEISNNLWQTYITPKENPEGASQPEEAQGPENSPA